MYTPITYYSNLELYEKAFTVDNIGKIVTYILNLLQSTDPKWTTDLDSWSEYIYPNE